MLLYEVFPARSGPKFIHGNYRIGVSHEIVRSVQRPVDEKCNRLGQGGGFYDRFLATVPPLVKTCGVAFEAQMVRSVPMDRHDRALDAVITESRLILRP